MIFSFLIPSYQSQDFIDECIDSIPSENEILIGIDSCQDTLNHILDNKDKYSHCKIYYFPENVGPYVIKNFLATKATQEYIITFDSDDILAGSAIQNISENIVDCDIFTLGFKNFKKDTSEIGSFIPSQGIFCIQRELFLKHNGYQYWKVGADSEFAFRMGSYRYMSKNSKSIDFNRRIHDNSLTSRPDTGYTSSLRLQYRNAIDEMIRSGNFNDPERNLPDARLIEY